MRNQSGEILRQVAEGETFEITNNGLITALIVPPGGKQLARLEESGQVRSAKNTLDILRSIRRRKSAKTSEALLADVRGRW